MSILSKKIKENNTSFVHHSDVGNIISVLINNILLSTYIGIIITFLIFKKSFLKKNMLLDSLNR